MSWTRRQFIERVAGGVGAGLLTTMAGELWVRAQSPAKLDRRFILNVHAMGWWTKLLRPEGMDGPASEWTLPEALSPLDSLKEQMLIYEMLDNPHHATLHGNYHAATSAQAGQDKFQPQGITIDRLIAQGLESNTPFSSINIGYPYGGTSDRPANQSADGPLTPYPALTQPADIMTQLFGEGGGEDALAAQQLRLERRLSVLDSTLEDASRMRGRLAAEEQQQMDQYLDSIRQVEQQLEQLAELNCDSPVWDGGDVAINRNISPELTAFYYQVAAVALQCGLTNVVSLHWEGVGGEPLQPIYDFDPVNMNVSHHGGVSHPMNGLDNDGSDASWAGREEHVSQVRRLYNWRSQMIADFWAQLAATDLGGYTIADRALMLWMNTGGNRHHQGGRQNPMIFLGNPDGVLNTGRHERFPNRERHVSGAFVGAARAMGIEAETFGSTNPAHQQGPLPGMLT